MSLPTSKPVPEGVPSSHVNREFRSACDLWGLGPSQLFHAVRHRYPVARYQTVWNVWAGVNGPDARTASMICSGVRLCLRASARHVPFRLTCVDSLFPPTGVTRKHRSGSNP